MKTFREVIDPKLQQVAQFTEAFEQNKQLVSAVRQEQTQSIMQLAAKASSERVKVIEEQLQRFALYEDFKALYGKVVPPIHDFQVAVQRQEKEIT